MDEMLGHIVFLDELSHKGTMYIQIMKAIAEGEVFDLKDFWDRKYIIMSSKNSGRVSYVIGALLQRRLITRNFARKDSYFVTKRYRLDVKSIKLPTPPVSEQVIAG